MSARQREQKIILEEIQGLVSPEVFSQVSAQLAAREGEVSDNQNQNQGVTEELAKLKPDVLREITIGSTRVSDEVSDNQNQNQGKLEDLIKLKPAALRQVRVSLKGGEVEDNQNQNQGSVAEAVAQSKPPLTQP